MKDETIERPLKGRGVGVIFHIAETDQFMFFLRDDKDSIPFPNMIDIIGGHMDPGETPEQTARRELGEELEERASGDAFQPDGIVPFSTYVDVRDVEQNIFGCELQKVPDLILKEGQRLVFLDRAELAASEFAFDFGDIVRAYAQTV
jgi:8-oxo-dGTP diphosphatase